LFISRARWERDGVGRGSHRRDIKVNVTGQFLVWCRTAKQPIRVGNGVKRYRYSQQQTKAKMTGSAVAEACLADTARCLWGPSYSLGKSFFTALAPPRMSDQRPTSGIPRVDRFSIWYVFEHKSPLRSVSLPVPVQRGIRHS
jgi:hypothetical protein